MVQRFFIILTLLAFSFGPALATQYTIEIDISYTAPTGDPDIIHEGYKLYVDGNDKDVNGDDFCLTDSTELPLICTIEIENGQHDFEVAATFTNQTISTKSPVFTFILEELTTGLNSEPKLDQTSDGAYAITYSWDMDTLDSTVAGYRMFLNGSRLCETSDLTLEKLTCYSDLLNDVMSFTVASFDSSGLASEHFNIITLNPADYPELFEKKKLLFPGNT